MNKNASSTIESEKVFNDEINLNNEPSKNVRDSWNQITLSLATNGGFTIIEKRKIILSVYIKETINGKQVYSIKSFYVSKSELNELQNESREFSDEIESMLTARDSEVVEESPTKTISKDMKKKEEVKKINRALTDSLKKSLDAVRKKDKNVDIDDLNDYGDHDLQDLENGYFSNNKHYNKNKKPRRKD